MGIFDLFRSKEKAADEMSQQADQCAEEIKNKWISYNNTLTFKSDVPLSKIIETFITPCGEFMRNKYPNLAKSAELSSLIVMTSILESGTHSKDEVNKAIQEVGNSPHK